MGGVDTTAAAPAQTQTPSPGILSFILPWNGPEVYPQIDWGNSDPNIDPGIKANLNELQNDFNSLNQNWQKEGHSAIQLNQVYRPQSYQAYYRSIWEINAIINNQDNTVGYQCDQTSHLDPAAVKAAYSQASAADKQTLQTKFNAHQVSGPTPAGCISDHASGIALDVLSPVSGSLYTQLIKESQNYGLCHNIAGDQPHYALLDKLSAGTNCNQQ